MTPSRAAPLRVLVVVEDEEVVADEVVFVDIAPGKYRGAVRRRRHLLVEDLVAQALGRLDLARRARQPDLERAEPAERFRQAGIGGQAVPEAGLQLGTRQDDAPVPNIDRPEQSPRQWARHACLLGGESRRSQG